MYAMTKQNYCNEEIAQLSSRVILCNRLLHIYYKILLNYFFRFVVQHQGLRIGYEAVI